MPRPKIFQVIPNDDFTVDVYFDDGNIKKYNAAPLIQKGGIFAVLGDIAFFKARCVILNQTLAWDVDDTMNAATCIDVCPDLLYGAEPHAA